MGFWSRNKSERRRRSPCCSDRGGSPRRSETNFEMRSCSPGSYRSGYGGSGVDPYTQRVLTADEPTNVSHHQQKVTVNNLQEAGFYNNLIKGFYANQSDAECSYSREDLACIPLSKHSAPQVLHKVHDCPGETVHTHTVRALKPCEPPPEAGDIIVEESPDTRAPSPPPIHVVVPGRASEPGCEMVIRECEPPKPRPIPETRIVLPPRELPPAPRRIIVEKLPDEPAEGDNVTVERWLAPERRQRRVIYKPSMRAPDAEEAQNFYIEWHCAEKPVRINLRLCKADCCSSKDPNAELRRTEELPEFARESMPPQGEQWAANACEEPPLLVGDVDILKRLNLDEVGLGEYKDQVYGGGGGGRYRSSSGGRQTCTTTRYEQTASPCPGSRNKTIMNETKCVDEHGNDQSYSFRYHNVSCPPQCPPPETSVESNWYRGLDGVPQPRGFKFRQRRQP